MSESTRSLVFLLVCATCKTDAGTVTKESPTAVPSKPAVADAATSFRDDASAFATANKLSIGAWGTAELDDVAGPDRFVELVPDPARETGVDEWGGYVVQSGDALYFLRVEFDGRTKPWIAREKAPAFTARSEHAIVHQQGHHGGFEERQLAVRGGTFVVLRATVQDDVRAGDAPVTTDYADAAGVCKTPCPDASASGFTVKRVRSFSEL